MKPYWEDDSGVLYHGDCLEVMKKLKTDKEKIILITDPPYGINYDPKKCPPGVYPLYSYEYEIFQSDYMQNHLF